jgi:hypothetical protein
LPKQNRVNPFGELIATEARGTLMGNRGCLHDEQQRIRRSFVGKRWIICVLRFRDRRRTVMAPGRYTELFFLDEATALAAGHRPCCECQRARCLEFRRLWLEANPGVVETPSPSLDEIDRALHAERIDRHKAKVTWPARLVELPSGAMVAEASDRAFLVLGKRLLPWSVKGYWPAVDPPADATFRVLTPRSVVRCLRGGFPVEIHPSARR